MAKIRTATYADLENEIIDQRKEIEKLCAEVDSLSGKLNAAEEDARDWEAKHDELEEGLADTRSAYEDLRHETDSWAKIKIDSLAQREKIEAFVKREIWPFETENSNYIIP